jgi:death-on-curing protein
MKYLTSEQVLFIHSRVIAETGGIHGVRDLGLLESAVARPQATFDGKELYADVFIKAAALMDSLVNNHPFADGNKRTGVMSAGLFLLINGYKLKIPSTAMADITMRVATKKVTIEKLAQWMRKNSRLV